MRRILTAIAGTGGRAFVTSLGLSAVLLGLMGYGPALVQAALVLVVWLAAAFFVFVPLCLATHVFNAAEPTPTPASQETPDA